MSHQQDIDELKRQNNILESQSKWSIVICLIHTVFY